MGNTKRERVVQLPLLPASWYWTRLCLALGKTSNPVLFNQVISIQAMRLVHSQLVDSPQSACCPCASSCQAQSRQAETFTDEGEDHGRDEVGQEETHGPFLLHLQNPWIPPWVPFPIGHTPLCVTCTCSSFSSCCVPARLERTESSIGL